MNIKKIFLFFMGFFCCAGTVRAESSLRIFVNSLTAEELDKISQPYSDSIRRKMTPAFPVLPEISQIRCTSEEFNQFTSSVEPDVALHAINIMSTTSLEEDLRSIDYYKNIAAMARKKNRLDVEVAASQVVLSLNKEKVRIEAVIARELKGNSALWKDYKVRHQAVLTAPNCMGILKIEVIELSHKWMLSQIGKYLENKLKADSALIKEVAKKQSCSPIPIDPTKAWLKYFRSSSADDWIDPWSTVLNCETENDVIVIRSNGKSRIGKDSVVIGKVDIK